MRHKLPGGAERVSSSGAGKLLADLDGGAWALSDALDWQRDDPLRHLHGGTDWGEVFQHIRRRQIRRTTATLIFHVHQKHQF
jgi:hypothetical protein